MDLIQVEKKWQKIWADTGLYKFDRSRADKKWYVLEMFSYPSGAKLHAGHWYNYGPADSYARFKKMQGYEVFQPMGFDAFGLPAENYAIKTGIHPQDSTMKNIATMEEQLKRIGAMYDWDYELYTCVPEYYKWTVNQLLKFLWNVTCRQMHDVHTCICNENIKRVEGQCNRMSVIQILVHDGFNIRQMLSVINESHCDMIVIILPMHRYVLQCSS